MHTWIIKCLECKQDAQGGDIKEPASLTKDEVLAQVEHLEECDVPNFDVGMLDVRNEVTDRSTTYTIKALRQ